ncbi:MAG: RHS repeat domain-containing protein [Chloroflexota bacterium]
MTPLIMSDTGLLLYLGDALGLGKLDPAGSVRQLTDVTGAVTFAQGYDPYGMVTLTEGAGHSAYGYTGEQQDVSGLVYLRAKYYDPAEGRFLVFSQLGRNRSCRIQPSYNDKQLTSISFVPLFLRFLTDASPIFC